MSILKKCTLLSVTGVLSFFLVDGALASYATSAKAPTTTYVSGSIHRGDLGVEKRTYTIVNAKTGQSRYFGTSSEPVILRSGNKRHYSNCSCCAIIPLKSGATYRPVKNTKALNSVTKSKNNIKETQE